MDFRLLGPLEVQGSNGPLALGGARQRALLAVLLLHANEVVSSDRLIEDLWGDEQPKEASKALQVAVSRLRRALEPDRPSGQTTGLLSTRPPGYELRLARNQLDLHRFEDLVAAGRAALAAGDPASAAAEIDKALALWRGPPLADLGFEPFLQGDVARLEELRVAALEDRIAANLQLGRHVEVVAELEALVRDHPMRERPREQLMLALYRSGRQADALAAFREARRTLIDELGIEPGHRLRELNEQVLAQAQALELQAPEKPATRPERGLFIGRERELSALSAALDDAVAGRGRLVLIAGEPGIGKSKLAEEVARDAEARGARVLIGRCWEAGGAPAYWPWVQSLRSYVQEAQPEALRAQLGAGAGDLAQLLPELHELYPDLPEPPAPDSEGARFRLFGAVSNFLRNAADAQPLALTLDDMHAADEPSLLLLRLVVRELAGYRLLLVCAFRDVDPVMGPGLSSTLAELVREPQTTQLHLTGLTKADVAAFVVGATGAEPDAQLVEALHVETEGNPFFIGAIVHLLHAEGSIAEADAHLRIPPEVRAVIGQRVARLSAHCREVLVRAAVIGREFGVDALARLTQLAPGELLDVLHEAMAERVVTDVPGTPGRLRFGHALIRDTLYDELTPAQRVRLHQKAGATLEALYSEDLDPHLAELAHHFFAAAPSGSAEKAVEYAHRAGDRATSQLAHEEAVRLYERALTLADKELERCELLLALGDAQGRAGDTPGMRNSFRTAADLAERLQLPEQLARAALGYGGRMSWDVSRGDVDRVPLLERALKALGDQDSRLRVRVMASLAGGPLRDASFPPERRRSLGRDSLDMARRLGDPTTVTYALAGYIAAHHSPRFTPEQVALATELLEMATQAGDLERAAEAHEHRAIALIELGDIDGARADIAVMAQLAEKLRQPSQDWLVVVYTALLRLLEGEFSEAEQAIAQARAVGERAQGWNALITHGLQLYVLRREQGRLAEVIDEIRRAADENPTYPIWRCVLAQAEAELGQAAEAQAALRVVAVDDFGTLPFDEEWLVSVSLLAETVTTLGETDRAEALYRLLLPYGDRVSASYPEISLGAAARYLGLLSAALGRHDEAASHFEQALQTNARIGARPWLAHTQADYARVLAAHGDHDRANELTSAAIAGYRSLGMDAFAADAALPG